MSEEQNVSLLDQLKIQRQQFIAQKELAQNNLHQLTGAIFATDEMIRLHEKELESLQLKDESNDEVINEIKE